ncbi:galectin-1-like [Hyperolius riggenbachi]|uniref:galectin-1-like n=1 Tax=Hyperolius riggenbachi TaxID=752182 RepID=UPI0035A27BBC
MACEGVVLHNLHLKPNQCVEVKGFIPGDSKGFAVNLGKDCDNFALHFNARFDQHGDTNKIVCNSKEANAWGAEQREDDFPFQQGAETTVCFSFQGDNIITRMSSGAQFTFPVRFPVDEISYVSLDGLQFKSLTVE